MAIKDLTSDQINTLVGTRHEQTGFEYPPAGLQPYYKWLLRQLHHLAESSAGAFRVVRDDIDSTTVRVMPGRATIGGVVLAYSGGTVDLAGYNNDIAYLWLEDNSGSAAIGVADDASGWPAGLHIKLAEIETVAGVIVSVLDRRFETMLSI